jgi:endonuclease/exonuclease/phosphatase family metal-dependent hydrolase
MKLKIMTYNVCSGRNFDNDRIINIRDAGKVIQKYAPDIVGLNEMRSLGHIDQDFTDQAKTLADMLGYHYYFARAIQFEGAGPYGNALLSRFPILAAETHLVEDPPVKDEEVYYETRCVLKAELDIPGGLSVYVSHYGLACSEERNAVKKTLELIQKDSQPIVFMGDLNMQPHDEKLLPIYEVLIDTAKASGDMLLTFPSDKPDRKIDYIFVSEKITVLSAQAPAETTSDHRPYIAEIELQA